MIKCSYGGNTHYPVGNDLLVCGKCRVVLANDFYIDPYYQTPTNYNFFENISEYCAIFYHVNLEDYIDTKYRL